MFRPGEEDIKRELEKYEPDSPEYWDALIKIVQKKHPDIAIIPIEPPSLTGGRGKKGKKNDKARH